LFQDIGVSKTAMEEYEKYCENHHINGLGTTESESIINKEII
jgi:hypothetical protein